MPDLDPKTLANTLRTLDGRGLVEVARQVLRAETGGVVEIADGPWDGGLDLRVRRDLWELVIQAQRTENAELERGVFDRATRDGVTWPAPTTTPSSVSSRATMSSVAALAAAVATRRAVCQSALVALYAAPVCSQPGQEQPREVEAPLAGPARRAPRGSRRPSRRGCAGRGDRVAHGKVGVALAGGIEPRGAAVQVSRDERDRLTCEGKKVWVRG
ncbi:MAG TPA: hypothetical protein PKA64_05445 [Myxococcota bacterium]|nr:hypothetical protein [Myxococcota bacterium]